MILVDGALQIAVALAVLGIGVGIAVAAGTALVRAAWRSAGLVGARHDLARAALDAQAAAEQARATLAVASVDRAAALQPRTYAPHVVYHQRVARDGGTTALPLDQTQPDQGGVPTFADLLQAGRVGRGNPLLLGVGASGDVAGSWLDLYSTALGGLPGTGKTTSQRFFACQTALHGARFVVCDPHYGTSDDSLGATLAPLRSCFACDVASSEARILDAVRFADDEGKRRLRSGERGPLILWVDEVTALLNSKIGPTLSGLMEEIARQYRKVGVYLSASGQIWLASRSGGTSALRDSFASVLAHRMKRNQARLLLPPDDAARCERLAVGHAVLYRTSGESETVVIPHTTAGDVQRVAGLLTDTAPTVARPAVTSVVTQVEPDAPAAGSPGESRETAPSQPAAHDAQTARVLAAFASGSSVRDIAKELCGVGSGRAYQDASERVQAIIRAAMGVVN